MNDLMRAFKFNAQDLANNRAGFATPDQLQLAREHGRIERILGLAVASIFGLGGIFFFCGAIAIVAVGGLIFLRQGADLSALRMLFREGLSFGGAALCIFPLLFGLPILIAFFILRARRQLQRDTAEGRVLQMTGPISLDRRRHDDTPDTYYLVIGSTRFELGYRQDEAVALYLGHPMTIYYLPRSKRIISLERASQQTAHPTHG